MFKTKNFVPAIGIILELYITTRSLTIKNCICIRRKMK